MKTRKKFVILASVAISLGIFTFGVIFVVFWTNVPNERLLVNAAAKDDLQQVKKIVAKGVSLNAPEEGMLGETPLIATTLNGGTNVFFYLLSAGANVNARDRMGETALMAAVTLGDANIVKIKALIDAGADVNASNRGVTVLQTAEIGAQGGHAEANTIALLKQHGAKK